MDQFGIDFLKAKSIASEFTKSCDSSEFSFSFDDTKKNRFVTPARSAENSMVARLRWAGEHLLEIIKVFLFQICITWHSSKRLSFKYFILHSIMFLFCYCSIAACRRLR